MAQAGERMGNASRLPPFLAAATLWLPRGRDRRAPPPHLIPCPTPPLSSSHADGWCARLPSLRTLSTPEEGNRSMVILAGLEQARTWLNGKIGRKGDKTYRMRFVAQAGFAFVCILLGI